jgi:hypothetical protein
MCSDMSVLRSPLISLPFIGKYIAGNTPIGDLLSAPIVVMMLIEYGVGAIHGRAAAARCKKRLSDDSVLRSCLWSNRERRVTKGLSNRYFCAAIGFGMHNCARFAEITLCALSIKLIHSIAMPIAFVPLTG